MKLGKETANLMNYLMSGSEVMPETGKDGTELCWTDRRSFKVLEYDAKKKSGVAAFYVDCYDAHTPLGTELKEPFRFKFAWKKWRKEVISNGQAKLEPWDVVFGVRNGYYDLSF